MARLVLTALLPCVLLLCGPPAVAEQDPAGGWPLAPRPEVVSTFDPPDTTYGRGHRGVDLAGTAGQGVRAALPGRVSFAGPLAGRGVVVVDHGPTRTTYEPVTALVAVGDAVTAGDPLGTLEAPLSHCFPETCLHWGWIRHDTYLDPLRLVGADAPVRLLPLWRDAPLPGTPRGAGESWRRIPRPAAAGPGLPLPSHNPAGAATRVTSHCCSGSRMGLVVGPPQSVSGDVGVALRGRQ